MKIKYIPFLFLLVGTFQLTAQKLIKGRVVTSQNIPVEAVSVYLNNTSIGEYTDHNGEFSFFVKEGIYDLIVSHIGFKTSKFKLDTEKYNKPFLIKLPPVANLLNEVVISSKKKKRKKLTQEERDYHLERFKKSFIGETKFAQNCKIVNEDDIEIEFDADTNTLTASSSKPIKIYNKALGYKIFYDLVYFELSLSKVSYLGYSKYEELKGSKRKKRKWKKNRKATYNGSIMHFVRSLRGRNFKENGFKVTHFKRVSNPKRPSDKVIQMAQAYIKKEQKRGRVYLHQVMREPKSKLDSAIYIIQRADRKKYDDVVLKKDVNYNDILLQVEQKVYLQFSDFLKIRYKGREEKGYRLDGEIKNYQESVLYLLTSSVLLDKSGSIIEPLDFMVGKYWGYLKFANTLPLDYEPEKT